MTMSEAHLKKTKKSNQHTNICYIAVLKTYNLNNCFHFFPHFCIKR